MNHIIPSAQPSPASSAPKQRDSNLELFRIIAMLLIIVHHYVVNSGLMLNSGPIFADPMAKRSQLLLMLGAFGKTGINCFVLITGYFMCASRITTHKFGKLLLEVMFYKLILSAVFWLTGYEAFSLSALIRNLIPVRSINQNFIGCFLIFYLCMPFLNLLIHRMDEKMHFRLLLLTGMMYVFFATVPQFSVSYNHVSWYAVLYLLASYTRLYPKRLHSCTAFWGLATLVFMLLSLFSIWAIARQYDVLHWKYPPVYTYVSDSNTFLATTTGYSAFMFFKNLKIRHSALINTLASSTFGILLIHAHSDAMRQWLWEDLLHNTAMYASPWMPLHVAGSTLGVFVICFLLDQLRIRLLEKTYMRLWDKCCLTAGRLYCKMESKLLHLP